MFFLLGMALEKWCFLPVLFMKGSGSLTKWRDMEPWSSRMEPSSEGLGKKAPYRAALFSHGQMVWQSTANLIAMVKAGSLLLIFFLKQYPKILNETVLAAVVLVVWAAANMQLQKYLSPSKVQSSIFANGFPHVRESEFWNPGNFFLRSLESWSLESEIQLKKSGISLTTGLHNPGSTDEDWSPVVWIWNPQYGIHNPRLSWIALHEAKIVKDSHHDYWLKWLEEKLCCWS